MSIRGIFKNKELNKKVGFTLGILMLFQLGNILTLPNVNLDGIKSVIQSNSLFAISNMFSAGGLSNLSLFALGIGPYITSSIVIQMLSMDVISYLSELKKGGNKGQKKLNQITFILMLILAFLQSFFMVKSFALNNVLVSNTFANQLLMVTLFVAGSCILFWLGGQIDKKGIGNGISMFILLGIVISLPSTVSNLFSILVSGNKLQSINGLFFFLLAIFIYLVILVGVVIMETSVRKIPVKYTSQTFVDKGNMTFIPLKLNSSGVMPVIIASSVITFPMVLLSFINPALTSNYSKLTSFNNWFMICIYGVLVFLFTFFYSSIMFSPKQVGEQLGKGGGFIPGVRIGKETTEYLSQVTQRITMIGAIFISTLAVLPYIIIKITNIGELSIIGGTSILLLVGISIETVKQIKQQYNKKDYNNYFKY